MFLSEGLEVKQERLGRAHIKWQVAVTERQLLRLRAGISCAQASRVSSQHARSFQRAEGSSHHHKQQPRERESWTSERQNLLFNSPFLLENC